MLYIISTPIGNLDDLSIRQAKTLMSSHYILAEDSRSYNILTHFIGTQFPELIKADHKPTIVSYYKEKEFEKLPEIISLLKDGNEVSLISENGTPLVSDPGHLLVKTVVKEKIPFVVIPGPSAVITALLYSGFNPSPKQSGFSFLGFFPKKPADGKRLIDKMVKSRALFPEMVFIFYESPHRIKETLKTLNDSGWDPDIAVCREMTKKFEEIARGKARQLMNRDYKGEITVVIR